MAARTDSSTTLVVTGVSGAGKSSVGARVAVVLGWEFAEGDDFHSDKAVAKMTTGSPLTDADRWPWLERLNTWIREREAAEQSSVVACSALKRSYRDVLRAGAPGVVFCHLVVPEAELRRRMESRHHFMPSRLLASQLATLEPLEDDEPGFEVDVQGDVDGTTGAVVEALGHRPG